MVDGKLYLVQRGRQGRADDDQYSCTDTVTSGKASVTDSHNNALRSIGTSYKIVAFSDCQEIGQVGRQTQRNLQEGTSRVKQESSESRQS